MVGVVHMEKLEADAMDRDMVRACQKGDAAAFEHLVAKHRPGIVVHAMRMLNDYHAAESAAQEVLLRLHRSIDSFREVARFSTWLYRITENVCLTRLAKKHREREKFQAYVSQMACLENADASGLDASVTKTEFASMIGAVGHDEQQILVMRFVLEWELSEIAVAMNLGLSATKMRFYRALEKLRHHWVGQDMLNAA
jgi:RNA polymerase sigma-70 factor, ECF subfamily